MRAFTTRLLGRVLSCAATVWCASAATAGDGCVVMTEDFDLFSDPEDVETDLFRATWCLNGASIAGGSFCPTNGALRLDADADEPVIRVESLGGTCSSVTIRFTYSQFAATSTFVLYERAAGAPPDCDGGDVQLAGFPSQTGGVCTPFEATVFLFPGEHVAFRIDHGGPNGTAFFIDDLEITAVGCCELAHDCCTPGSAGCADDTIEACVCDFDPFCCEVVWDEQCVAEVERLGCGSCDGGGGSECATALATDFGTTFQSGTVCAAWPDVFASCTGNGPYLTTSGGCAGPGDAALSFGTGFPYSSATTPCLAMTDASSAAVSFTYSKTSGTLGPIVEVAVGDGDFATLWSAPVVFDGGCADVALDLTPFTGGAPIQLRFASGSSIANGARIDDVVFTASDDHACCSAGGAGCADPSIEACVCAIDPFCCDTAWDDVCVLEAEFYGCAACGLCRETTAIDFGDTFVAGSICAILPDDFVACTDDAPTLTSSGACAGAGDYALRFAGASDPPMATILRCVRLVEAHAPALRFRYAKSAGEDGPHVLVSLDAGGSFEPLWSAPLDAASATCHDACIDLAAYAGNPYLMLRFDGGTGAASSQWIDDVEINDGACPPPPVLGDLDGDGVVGFTDLLMLIAAWGGCAGCPADFDDDGRVGLSDLITLLSAWSA